MNELEKEIYKFLKERSWHNLRPGDLSKSVTIEAAELLEVFQWDNPSLEDVKNDPERMESIKKELADVFIYCLEISVLLGLDSETVVREKLEKIKKKYPAELFVDSNNDQKMQELYWQIKKEHRKNGF